MKELVEQQRRHFDGVAGRYVAARQTPNHLLLKDLIWSEFLADKRYLAQECPRVLELMCGLGEGYSILRQHVFSGDFDYLGMDYSQPMIDAARENNPGLHFEHGDVTSFEPPREQKDLIVIIGGLHHVHAQCERVITRVSAALRSGAYFLSFEPTHNCWMTRRVRERVYKKNALFDAESERGFEMHELENLFSRHGFRCVDQVHAGLLAYILYYNPDAFPRLNLGSAGMVRTAFRIDKLFWRGWLGRKLSFATIGLWQKN